MNGHPVEPVKLQGFGPQDLYQKRERIFTRHVGGFFQKLRLFSGWPLLLGFFGTPWLMWDERQAVLFDLPARQFHIFSLTIWPQDLWLLGWILMIAAFGLFTVTTVVGRLWCGYTCPQTVWTAIFMWVEQITEGPRHQRIRLDRAPWTWRKVRLRATKHAMWLAFAALTGLTFVGYFTPVRELTVTILTLEVGGWAAFWVALFTAGTYVNAGWMREQVCLYMCPYARFQSAMIDKDTLIVSYDERRGESRGARKRGSQDHGLGDCIDCQLCVQVCPTGIDIRDGLQYECIGCAHCIDACNQVMQKMGYAPGLVRYTTQHALEGGAIRWLRGRSIGYASICVLIIGAFVWAVFEREQFAFDVLRERGALYRTSSTGMIVNDYQLKLMNKGQEVADYAISILNPTGIVLTSENLVRVAPGDVVNVPLVLQANPAIISHKADVSLRVCMQQACVEEMTTFLGPMLGTRGSSGEGL